MPNAPSPDGPGGSGVEPARTVAGTNRRRPRSRADRSDPTWRQKLANLPVTIRFGVPLLIVALAAVEGFRALRGPSAYLSVAGASGTPVTRGVLEFFVYDDSGSARWPTAKLGELPFEGEGPFEVGPELVPEQALVRIRAEGFGLGYHHVKVGDVVNVCEIGPPARTEGRVLGPDGKPAEGAQVLALGGCATGVLLAKAATDAEGKFVLEGFTERTLHVRVLKESCAALQMEWRFDGEQERDLTLQRTRPVRGRVVSDAIPVGGLIIQAFNVLGVETQTAEDGTFVLDHVPAPPTQVRLLVATLPSEYTHAKTLAEPGSSDVEIRLLDSGTVEGRVFDGATGLPLPGAWVQHEHGPAGVERAHCDSGGYFRIGRLPAGPVTLSALLLHTTKDRATGKPRKSWLHGFAKPVMQEGETRSDVALTIER